MAFTKITFDCCADPDLMQVLESWLSYHRYNILYMGVDVVRKCQVYRVWGNDLSTKRDHFEIAFTVETLVKGVCIVNWSRK